MATSTVLKRTILGGKRHVTVGARGIEVRGGRRDRDVAYENVRRLRFSRTWTGFNRFHLRWTIVGTRRDVTVFLDAGPASSPEMAAFTEFMQSCLVQVASTRPDIVVIIGMTRIGWCLWLGTAGLALAGLVAAFATMVDGEALLAALPAILALLAGLPVCWKNLMEGWGERFSAHEAGAVLARLTGGAMPGRD